MSKENRQISLVDVARSNWLQFFNQFQISQHFEMTTDFIVRATSARGRRIVRGMRQDLKIQALL